MSSLFYYKNLSRCTVTWASIYHDALSPESQFITMHCHLNVNLSRCSVTWTSIYHVARSPERQFVTTLGHLNVNLSRCKVTWTSIYHDARSPEHQIPKVMLMLNDVKRQICWRITFLGESMRCGNRRCMNASQQGPQAFGFVATLLHPPLLNATSGYNSGSKMGSRGQGTCLWKNKHNYLIRSVAGSRVGSTRTQLCLLFPVFSLHRLYTVLGLK